MNEIGLFFVHKTFYVHFPRYTPFKIHKTLFKAENRVFSVMIFYISNAGHKNLHAS